MNVVLKRGSFNSHWIGIQKNARVGDTARDGRSGHGSGARQVYLSLRVSHSADKVPVGRRNASFPASKHAHVSAQTGSARRRRNNAAGFGENFEKALFQSLSPNRRSRGHHDRPDASRYSAAFEYAGRLA